MSARPTECANPGSCGLCQLRAEWAAEDRAAYAALQRDIDAAIAAHCAPQAEAEAG